MAKKQVNFSSNPLFSGPSYQQRVNSVSPYREISLQDIDVDPNQPRGIFNESSLSELADSIREHGLITPILVRPLEGGTYRLVAGERRFRASKLAGLKSIPAVLEQAEVDEGSRLSKQLVENLQREDLSPMEKALAIGQLKSRFELSIRDIAKKLGISKSSVQRSLEILTFPEDLQEALLAGEPESKILILSKLEDLKARREILSKLSEYTRDQLEEYVSELNSEVSHGGTGKEKKTTAPQKQRFQAKEDLRIEDELQKALGTKITLLRKKGKEGQGRLQIDFYSDEELNGLFQKLIA